MELFQVLERSGAKLPCQGPESCFSHVHAFESFFVLSHFLCPCLLFKRYSLLMRFEWQHNWLLACLPSSCSLSGSVEWHLLKWWKQTEKIPRLVCGTGLLSYKNPGKTHLATDRAAHKYFRYYPIYHHWLCLTMNFVILFRAFIHLLSSLLHKKPTTTKKDDSLESILRAKPDSFSANHPVL